MNFPEILERALREPVTLNFETSGEAASWRFRAYNFIRRKAPHFQGLVILKNGRSLTVKWPRMEVEE